MGSSYRQDLKRATEHDPVVSYLRQAVELISRAHVFASEEAEHEDQLDNASDTGGLLERLSIACKLIEDALPPKP